MSFLKTKPLSHYQRVCRLYKKGVRTLYDYYAVDRPRFRYEAVKLRHRFDVHKDETDVRKAKQLLLDGEKELQSRLHTDPVEWAESPGGPAYMVHYKAPDMVFDHYHPIERKEYPEYFALREKRKKEFVEQWEKKYGQPVTSDGFS